MIKRKPTFEENQFVVFTLAFFTGKPWDMAISNDFYHVSIFGVSKKSLMKKRYVPRCIP